MPTKEGIHRNWTNSVETYMGKSGSNEVMDIMKNITLSNKASSGGKLVFYDFF